MLRLPIFVLLAAMAGLSPAAHAVDLPPAPVLDDDDGSEELGSGWYLRGDVSVLDQNISRRSRDSAAAGFSSLVNGKTDHAFALGGGLGYRFSPWFRTDATVEHRFEAAFTGTRFGALDAVLRDRADMNATTFWLNGYLDLPLWSGIAPYLGGGIGAGVVHFEGLTSTVARQSDTLLAWALMAGFTFDLTTHLTIDLGYRYSRFEGDRFGASATLRPVILGAHEFRVGARYLFD